FLLLLRPQLTFSSFSPDAPRRASAALPAATYLPSSPSPAETSRVDPFPSSLGPAFPFPSLSFCPTSTGELPPPPPASVHAFFRRRLAPDGESSPPLCPIFFSFLAFRFFYYLLFIFFFHFSVNVGSAGKGGTRNWIFFC